MAKRPTPPPAPAAGKSLDTGILVQAKAAGFYEGHRRPGERFALRRPEDLAPWMTPLGGAPTAGAAVPAPDTTVMADLRNQLAAARDELAKAQDIGVAEFLAARGFKPGDLLEIQEDGSVRVTPAEPPAA